MATKRDYYEVLQVTRNASGDEIKKSYRKLAIQYHPDRNPNDKQAEEKFKEAAEAYEILSDQNKRQRYNQFGHAGVDNNGFSSGFSNVEDVFENFGSIFEDLFGMGSNRGKGNNQRARKGSDLKFELKISFKEAILGVEKKIQVPRRIVCTSCAGTGAAKGTKPVNCSTCRGQGQVAIQQGFFTYASTCPDCHGAGKKIQTPCGECRGSAYQSKEDSINIKIPAGIDTGMRFRVGGEGEAGTNGGPAGDLYVFIEVEADERFKREESDLICPIRIGIAQAILGTEVEIDCFEEKPRKIDIPAGIQPGQRIVIHGAGVQKLEKYGRGKGNLVIEVNVEIPTKIPKEAEEHLREFANKMGQQVKDNSGFFDKFFG